MSKEHSSGRVAPWQRHSHLDYLIIYHANVIDGTIVAAVAHH